MTRKKSLNYKRVSDFGGIFDNFLNNANDVGGFLAVLMIENGSTERPIRPVIIDSKISEMPVCFFRLTRYCSRD